MTVSAPCSPVAAKRTDAAVPRANSETEVVIQTAVDDVSSEESQADLPDLVPATPHIAKKQSTLEKMMAKRPKFKPGFVPPKVWMVVFGIILAQCAGCVNVVTYSGLRMFTSHVSGTVSKVGMRLEGSTIGLNDTWDILHCVFMVGSFIFGAMLCGFLIPKNEVHFGGKSLYGIALIGNSVLLVIATCITPKKPLRGDDILQTNAIIAGCLAAMACGLQNAMCTMHFGAVVRTTHVTGSATDIGSTTGRALMIWIRTRFHKSEYEEELLVQLTDELLKLKVLVLIFLGFFSGTLIGSFLYAAMGMHALLVPAIITGTTGIAYGCFREVLKKAFKKQEEKKLHDDIQKVDVALRRASSLLAEAKTKGGPQDDVSRLASAVRSSLARMRDVEEGVKEVYGRRPSEASYNRAFTV